LKSAGPDVSNDPTPADNSASAVTQLSYARAQLRVTKTPSFRRVNARAAVRYRIRVQALGSVAAVGVRVCDRLDPYLTVISAPHARFSAGSPCWTLPRLDPGHPRVFTIRVVADNVPRARHAPDTASASALNAPTAHARATLAIKPRPIPSPVTG
jgi:hypothetical protein